MDFQQFENIQHYVAFDAGSAALLGAFHPIAAPHFPRIVDDFYAAIEAHADAKKSITGGKPQIERLKRTLIAWLDSVLVGPYDEAFLLAHSRIGRVHVRIALPQEYMFTAMNRIRVRLTELARAELAGDPARMRDTLTAIHQILDLELAIMVDTYRENLAEKIRTTERLATIGQLAASIGHELRNPLGIIESSLFLVRQRLDKLGLQDPQIDKHREKMLRQVKQCSKTITNLLDLARDRPPRRRLVPVRQVLDSALEAAALPEGIRLESDVPSDLLVDADPDDLMHVIVNLLSNAAQAQKGEGRIRVTAEEEKGGTAISVVDDGPGVPPEHQGAIFDALFTTKARGTGLGLALSRRVVDAHGGEIALLPSERGARFRLWIPETELATTAGAE
jgi:two-component system, NtrC family, sensor histidine kinase HydH